MGIHRRNCSANDTYKLLSGFVVPRSIALVSTKDDQGQSNVAPFSFFNVVANEPPTVMFSADKRNGEKKETIANIKTHSEFDINIVSEKMAQKMHNSAGDFKKEVNEFDEVGLTPITTHTNRVTTYGHLSFCGDPYFPKSFVIDYISQSLFLNLF